MKKCEERRTDIYSGFIRYSSGDDLKTKNEWLSSDTRMTLTESYITECTEGRFKLT